MNTQNKSRRFELTKSQRGLDKEKILRQMSKATIGEDGERYADFEDAFGKIHKINTKNIKKMVDNQIEADVLFRLWSTLPAWEFEEKINSKRISDKSVKDMISMIEKDKGNKQDSYKYVDTKKVKESIDSSRSMFSNVIINPDICVRAKINGYMKDGMDDNFNAPFCKEGEFYRVISFYTEDSEMDSMAIQSVDKDKHHWNINEAFHKYFEIVEMPYSEAVEIQTCSLV
jgi:hypothetical protein